MTFCGENIGNTATLTQVEIYVAEKGLFIEPQEAYDYWAKKNWLTNKGQPVKTLESAIDVINGIAILKSRKNGRTKEKPKKVTAKNARRAAMRIALENEGKTAYVEYQEQLKDYRWKSFRRFVFEVRGKKCEICGATDYLQVHHLKYRKVKAWEYTVNEVLVVCSSCHKKIHGIE